MISGFTVVRNVETLGYPFMESVRSALPICAEYIISEGYSSDRTWEAVQVLANRYPDKIRVRRDRWTDVPDNGEVIARISNLALADCRSDYCLYLQANEVLHEDSLALISSLARRYPKNDLFALPFFNMLGFDRLWLVQNRNRLFRHKAGIRVAGDGYDAGFCAEHAPVNSFFSPFGDKWSRLGSRLRRILDQPVNDLALPRPVYRYRALYPANYLHKLEIRREMMKKGPLKELWDQELAAARDAEAHSGHNPAEFWERMTRYFDRQGKRVDQADLRPESARRSKTETSMPAVMTALAECWEYSLDVSLRALDAPTPT
jgi:glycosyltransferase involved in cell wall biosynthesis